jgi:hypothetical protein
MVFRRLFLPFALLGAEPVSAKHPQHTRLNGQGPLLKFQVIFVVVVLFKTIMYIIVQSFLIKKTKKQTKISEKKHNN